MTKRTADMPLFHRTLVPHDFSAAADAALALAADIAGRSGGTIVVLHVLTPFYTGPAFPTREEIAWVPTNAILARLGRELEARVAGVVGAGAARHARCRVVHGDPLTCILEAARGADVIVMATTGRTGLPRMVIGSVAEKVVRHSPIPVLTVCARGRRGRRPARARRRTPKGRAGSAHGARRRAAPPRRRP